MKHRDDNGLTTLQLQVDQGGTQSFFEALATPGQLEVIGSWSLPKILLALAAINASLA